MTITLLLIRLMGNKILKIKLSGQLGILQKDFKKMPCV